VTGGRIMYAGLHLLDRQILDREGRLAGNVDDLQLERDEHTGQLFVTALLTGPGVLSQRWGLLRWGDWVRKVHATMWPRDDDPAVIPMGRVSEFGNHITVGADHSDLGSFSLERWVCEHLIDNIPGSDHDAGG
jgi:sporulation protein YlmC with PRC-barrel domain